MSAVAIPQRKYDKGERRFKHVGKGPEPKIEFDDKDPKRWIGKCPSTLSAADQVRLLNEAVAAGNGDRDLGPPKKLYTVYEGAIYEAQTSDRGRTYHGYPYRGKLSVGILRQLEALAVQKRCKQQFDDWVKMHIERHGDRR